MRTEACIAMRLRFRVVWRVRHMGRHPAARSTREDDTGAARVFRGNIVSATCPRGGVIQKIIGISFAEHGCNEERYRR